MRKCGGRDIGDAIVGEQQMRQAAGQIGGHGGEEIVVQLERDEDLEPAEGIVFDVGDAIVREVEIFQQRIAVHVAATDDLKAFGEFYVGVIAVFRLNECHGNMAPFRPKPIKIIYDYASICVVNIHFDTDIYTPSVRLLVRPLLW